MNSAMILADPSVLTSIEDGPLNACRPADVKYVRLQLTLDVCELCTAATSMENTFLLSKYYLDLPRGVCTLMEGTENPCNLTTFLGTADLCTLSVTQINAKILSLIPQDGPVELAAAFNVPQATSHHG